MLSRRNILASGAMLSACVAAPRLSKAQPASKTVYAADWSPFTIAGDNKLYIAPSGIDVRLYAGQLVEVRLDQEGRVKNITLASRR